MSSKTSEIKGNHNAAVILNIRGKEVLSVQITLDELVEAYWQFIELHGAAPISRDCTAKNNLPQMRIIRRVLADNNITYGAFMSQFGKSSHVRSEIECYDDYVKQYITQSKVVGHTITYSELFCNQWGLPSPLWFVSNCPDKTVTTFPQFVSWCGLMPAKKVWTRDEVGNALCDLESELHRPTTSHDIRPNTVGFSMIVVSRLFGSLGNAKHEFGLSKSLSSKKLPFEFYREKLDQTVLNIVSATKRNTITWKEIEDNIYCPDGYVRATDHKTYMRAFRGAGVDLIEHLKSNGVEMCPSSFSFVHTLDDGERTRSNMEYDATMLLRSLGLVYRKDYFRDVQYRQYFSEPSNIDCDYDIVRGSEHRFLEIAGMIHSPSNADWRSYQYDTRIKCEYRDKMILKERRLKEAGVPFLFVFSNDMQSGAYVDLITDFVK